MPGYLKGLCPIYYKGWTYGLVFFHRTSMNRLKGSGHGVNGQPYSCKPACGAFWERSTQVCLSPPMFWYRYVDDTWDIQQQTHNQLFLDHIKSIDPAIKFTVEGNQENRAIPFPHTLVKPGAGNSLSIKVYYKPTHTDQYLQWDSHQNLSAKYSVIGTLTHWAKTVCTTLELLNEQLQHLKEASARCKYPKLATIKY